MILLSVIFDLEYIKLLRYSSNQLTFSKSVIDFYVFTLFYVLVHLFLFSYLALIFMDHIQRYLSFYFSDFVQHISLFSISNSLYLLFVPSLTHSESFSLSWKLSFYSYNNTRFNNKSFFFFWFHYHCFVFTSYFSLLFFCNIVINFSCWLILYIFFYANLFQSLLYFL
jgi:hypothetical protein